MSVALATWPRQAHKIKYNILKFLKHYLIKKVVVIKGVQQSKSVTFCLHNICLRIMLITLLKYKQRMQCFSRCVFVLYDYQVVFVSLTLVLSNGCFLEDKLVSILIFG